MLNISIFKNRRLLLITLLAWNLIALSYVSSAYLDAYRFNPNFSFSWPFVLLVFVVYNSWGLLSIVLYKRLQKPVEEQQWWRCGVVFILGLLLWQPLISSFDVLMSRIILGVQAMSFWQQLLSFRLLDIFHQSLLYTLGYFACAVVIYVRYSQRIQLQAARLERQSIVAERDLADMKMQVLQTQLSPHFLFNCLNSISAMARHGKGASIVEATAQLAELLRYALAAGQRSLVPLQSEIEFTQRYIDLQKLRFGARYICRLQTMSQVQQQLLECPPFVLQTLIENAFTHSQGQLVSPVLICADISLEEHRLQIIVSNSIHDAAQQSKFEGLNLALSNLRNRLQLIYGEHYSILEAIQDGEFIVKLILPCDSGFSTNTQQAITGAVQ